MESYKVVDTLVNSGELPRILALKINECVVVKHFGLSLTEKYVVHEAHTTFPAQYYLKPHISLHRYWNEDDPNIEQFSPIYFIVVETKKKNDHRFPGEVVYVGKTENNKSNRFGNGHKATQCLNDPKYDGMDKYIQCKFKLISK
ncbi:hypothetical protein [Paenibacillus sp. FJAT-27812]|uniref:hypothetical protein n=1 Tax=Paenibacillus sp. FJAT-27812 TaxID=1684143 RepID=UPI0006A7D9CF|nr:hypothetical protein [Paenibacillus sp. FJAT-27812]